MTGGFDANVPARKPRTRIGRVLTELASDTEDQEWDGALDPGATEDETRAPAGADAAPAPASVSDAADLDTERRAPARPAPNGVQIDDILAGATGRSMARAPRPLESTVSAPRTGADADTVQESPRLAAGRERVASLRERLASASRQTVAVSEPKRTLAAVVGVVEDLRARLDAAIRERAEMGEQLDETRSTLGRAEIELQKERKLRTTIEARERERIRIAEDALAEAEALAAERDQVLSELTEQRRLDDEQAALLAEAEEVLERRDEERAATAARMADLGDELEARSIQIADLESRLKASEADRARIEARAAELEEEVQELAEARQALEAIEASLNPRS